MTASWAFRVAYKESKLQMLRVYLWGEVGEASMISRRLSLLRATGPLLNTQLMLFSALAPRTSWAFPGLAWFVLLPLQADVEGRLAGLVPLLQSPWSLAVWLGELSDIPANLWRGRPGGSPGGDTHRLIPTRRDCMYPGRMCRIKARASQGARGTQQTGSREGRREGRSKEKQIK